MISEGTALYLKSGMPLGVLMPAPTMTTTLLQALVRSSSATSFRESFTFSLLPPHPKLPEAPTERDMGLLPPVILTARAQRKAAGGNQSYASKSNRAVLFSPSKVGTHFSLVPPKQSLPRHA